MYAVSLFLLEAVQPALVNLSPAATRNRGYYGNNKCNSSSSCRYKRLEKLLQFQICFLKMYKTMFQEYTLYLEVWLNIQ